MESRDIKEQFQILSKYLKERNDNLFFDGKYLIPEKALEKKKIPLLKHYFVGPEIEKTIRHNLEWAKGRKKSPEFKFAYMALPTNCNQRCIGCFTGKDKGFLPEALDGGMYSKEKIGEIINFLKEHK